MNHGNCFDYENVKDRKRRIAEQEKRAKEREIKEKLKKAAPDLLDACKKAEAAFVSRNENEMMQAQCICTAIIARI